MGQPGFFDLDERYESLSRCGDPLEVLDRLIPWESFRYPIKKALIKPRKSAPGRKSFDPVLMFKVLVLQSLYNLSDQQTGFQIRDRLSYACWTVKHGVSHFGYKNHISMDVKHKLIRKWAVTPACVHDSKIFEELLDENNSGRGVWADSAYRSEEIEERLRGSHRSQIHHKGYRDHPLSEAKQKVNQKRSRTRARVEHIFGFQATSMGGSLIRCVGQVRATHRIGMRNLVYNMCRYTQLLRLKSA